MPDQGFGRHGLTARQYGINTNLSAIDMADMLDDDADDEIRSAGEIAKRALALAAVVSCAHGASRPKFIAWLKNEALWDGVTPMERKFLLEETPAKARIALTWRVEASVPLLWAIGKLDQMPGLGKQCDVDLTDTVVWPPNSTAAYISSSALRGEEEIYAEYEKVYQAHWKIRDAQLNGKAVPRRLNPEVVHERHHGFNWLIGYMGQSWDGITTDT